ncbi:barwin-like endoglucanase [Pyrrhoderma noxium]|uniref:Barwin-like endoglucanase n=1 Tax=Pyrrhoderma noxium TaxID=2282107 RepID=A0A286UD18_9AGAM|nr:barwin-like endoglucanase [Pyrrhoderma noxium]
MRRRVDITIPTLETRSFPSLPLIGRSSPFVQIGTPPFSYTSSLPPSFALINTHNIFIIAKLTASTQDLFEQGCHPLEANESLSTAIPSKCVSSSSATTSDSLDEPAYVVSTDDEDKNDNGGEDEKLLPILRLLETLQSGQREFLSGNHPQRLSRCYAQGNPGTCGVTHFDSDLVAAINIARFTDSSLCGSQVKITNTNNGATVTVTISEACITCLNKNSLDLSPGAFLHLSPILDTGIIPISWFFV